MDHLQFWMNAKSTIFTQIVVEWLKKCVWMHLQLINLTSTNVDVVFDKKKETKIRIWCFSPDKTVLRKWLAAPFHVSADTLQLDKMNRCSFSAANSGKTLAQLLQSVLSNLNGDQKYRVLTFSHLSKCSLKVKSNQQL